MFYLLVTSLALVMNYHTYIVQPMTHCLNQWPSAPVESWWPHQV